MLRGGAPGAPERVALPVVTDTLVRPDLTPITKATVEIRLFLNGTDGVAYLASSEIFPKTTLHPDAAGLISVTLPANSTLTPSGSYYQVAISVPGELTRYETIIVPAGAGPYVLGSILSVTPTAGIPFLSDALPLALGATALPGTDLKTSRDDHVHPLTGIATDAEVTAAIATQDALAAVYEVRRAGIYPTNTAAQNTAAMATLLAAVNAGAGHVKFGPGTYSFNATVNWPSVSQNLVIEGAGLNTILSFTQADGTDAWVFLDDVPSNAETVVRDLRLKSTAGASSGNGMVFRDRVSVALYSVWVTDFGGGAGIFEDGLEQSAMFHCTMRRNKYGAHLRASLVGSHLGPNANSFYGCQFDQNTDAELWLTDAQNIGVFGGTMQGTSKNGVLLTGTNVNITLQNVYFEGCNELLTVGQGAVAVQGTANHLHIKNCNFNTAGDILDFRTATPSMYGPLIEGGIIGPVLIGSGVQYARLDVISQAGTFIDEGFHTSRIEQALFDTDIAKKSAANTWALGQTYSAAAIFNAAVTANAALNANALLTAAAGITVSAGNLLFSNAAGQYIDWGTNGLGAPTFTTRSAGAKLVLRNNLSGSLADFALGVESGRLWLGVPGGASTFGFYSGTTLKAIVDPSVALFTLFNQNVDVSNYSRFVFGLVSSVWTLQPQQAGTGTPSDMRIGPTGAGNWLYLATAGADRWTVRSDGHLIASTDAVSDIGNATQRPRDLYNSRNHFNDGYLSLKEMTAPGVAAADRVRLYAEDNGSGKTRLMAIFQSGAAVQLAIEP